MGLSDKIADTIAEEVPLLLGVPEFALDLWRKKAAKWTKPQSMVWTPFGNGGVR